MTTDRLAVHCIAVPDALADQMRLYVTDSPHWGLSWSETVTDLPACDAVVIRAELLPDLRAFRPTVVYTAQVVAFGAVELLPISLMQGATDYLRLPWAPTELFARLRRRFADVVRAANRFGLSLVSGAVATKQVSIPLSAAEFRILRLLLRFAGEVVSRQALYYAIWGHRGAHSRVVDVHISALRKKLNMLGSASAVYAIRAVRGEGYVFVGFGPAVDNL